VRLMPHTLNHPPNVEDKEVADCNTLTNDIVAPLLSQGYP